MGEAMRNITIKVKLTGVRRARVRMWLGAKLFALAAWITGTDWEIEA